MPITAHPPSRRQFLGLAGSAALSVWVTPAAALSVLPPTIEWHAAEQLRALEQRSGGRLGVFAIDGARPTRPLGYRADQRFGLCSTFKLLLAAVVLREADRGRIDLDERLPFGPDDLVPHAPVIEKHLAAGSLSILQLAEAGQLTSDNVAANLLLRRLGGPAAVTAMLRDMGDGETRLDRIEPTMNLVPPGELRDTTTPQAMATITHRLFNSDLLSAAAQQRLKDWMIATATGRARIRAGLPSDWIAGDKTGTGIAPVMANKHNDVAVIWVAGQAPVAVAAYYEADGHYPGMRPQDDAVLAEVGRIVARWMA
jgi:beta-lactamase class A